MQRVKKLNNKLNHYFSNHNYIRHSRHLRLVFFSASAALIAIMTLAVFPIIRETSTAEAASSGTASSITMTTTSALARLNLNVTDPSGVFVKSSSNETINFGVKTNNYTGYTLSISSDDDLGYLTNTDTSITTNNKLSSISSVIDEKTFDDTTYNGQWGYVPSKINSVDNVAFLPSPTTTATTLDTTESANPDTNNDYTIGLGARADYSLSAGTYAHTFNLAATANPVVYTVTYQDNTGDTTVYNLPDSIVDNSTTHTTTTATEITLSSVTPSRTGYVFAGWCDIAPTNSGQTCSGTTYAAGSTYGINQTTSNNIVLYATWSIPTYNITIKPSTGIASVSLNGTTCTNADVTTPGDSCIVSGLVYGNSYTLSATSATGYSFATWSNIGAGEVTSIQNNNTTYVVGEGESTIIATTLGGTYSLSINFAGTGVSSVQVRTAAGTSAGTTIGTVSTSGGAVKGLIAGQAYYLYPTFNSGYMLGNWTMSGTGYLSCNLDPSTNTCTGAPNPVFVAEAGDATITITGTAATMQAFTAAQCNALPIGTTLTLKDTRDNKEYRIRKLGDYRCWMIDDLKLGYNASNPNTVTITLKTTDSNVFADTTITAYDLVSNGASGGNCYGTRDVTTGLGSGKGYTTPCITSIASNADTGTPVTMYNFAMATAGTIVGAADNATAASVATSDADICPVGWGLPTRKEYNRILGYRDQLNLIAPGSYYNGYLSNPGLSGAWWAREANTAVSRARLDWWQHNTLYVSTLDRISGGMVRCIRNS